MLKAPFKSSPKETEFKSLNVSSGKSGGKKLNAPIVLEFANMISALEKSQQHTDSNKFSPGSSQRMPAGYTHIVGMKVDPQGVNIGNMKSGVQTLTRRGKERENPKPKKKSTLKKVRGKIHFYI